MREGEGGVRGREKEVMVNVNIRTNATTIQHIIYA